MEKDQLLCELENLLQKLDTDVIPEINKDFTMGCARCDSWVRLSKRFFEVNLPSYLYHFNAKADARIIGSIFPGETLSGRFLKVPVKPMKSLIKSLIIDIQQDELILPLEDQKKENLVKSTTLRKAFIVHGHDESTKLQIARFLEKLKFDAVILHEQASGGKTIIEKLEHFTDVGFSIVLYTPDDVGEAIANQVNLKSRARQNVVFEHGLLIGKLGRERVLPLVTDHNVELPGDISGMVYMSDRNWEIDLAKEIKALGYDVDLNSLV